MAVRSAVLAFVRDPRAKFALKIIVSAALIGLLLLSVDVGQLLAELRTASPGLVALAFLIGIIQIGFSAWRWATLVRALGARLASAAALRLTFIGSFFNQTLPSAMGGDIYRMYLSYKLGVPLAKAINSILLERVLMVLGLLILALAFSPALLGGPAADDWPVILGVILLLSVGAVAGTFVLMGLNLLPLRWRRFRIVRGLGELSADTRRLFLAPLSLVRPMGVMLLSLVNLIMVFWVLALALGVDLSFPAGLALFPLVLLATAIPISVGGWGVREGAMVAILGLVDVPAEPAFAVSVLAGLIAIVGSLPGGLVWLAEGPSRPHLDQAAAAEMTEAASQGE